MAQRPAYISEKFWDAEKGAPRVEELSKSYGQLEKLLGKRSTELDNADYKQFAEAQFNLRKGDLEKQLRGELLGQRPESADKYELKFSDEHAARIPEQFRDLAAYKDDPLIASFRSFCYDAGLGNDKFNHMVGEFLVQRTEQAEAAREAQVQALGENAAVRLETVSAFLKQEFGDEGFLELAPAFSSAAAVEAIEHLMNKINGIPGDGAGAAGTKGAAGAKSEAEIKQMMQDKRYWHPRLRDEAYVREVQEHWKRAFPGQVQIG